jgi:hypothetical protein
VRDPQAIARLIGEAYLRISDHGFDPQVSGEASDRRQEGHAFLRLGLESLCDLYERGEGEAIFEVIDALDPGALRFLMAQAIAELDEIGYRDLIADELARSEAQSES